LFRVEWQDKRACVAALVSLTTGIRSKRKAPKSLDGENPSEVRLINQLFPDGVLNMDTALFYHGCSDRTPSAWLRIRSPR
jgi:hypothetical protein